jgi:hypothetical protein
MLIGNEFEIDNVDNTTEFRAREMTGSRGIETCGVQGMTLTARLSACAEQITLNLVLDGSQGITVDQA